MWALAPQASVSAVPPLRRGSLRIASSELVFYGTLRIEQGLSGIQGAGDHVGNAGALAGMQQHEHDKANTRNSPDDKDQNKQRIHVDVLLYRGQKIAA